MSRVAVWMIAGPVVLAATACEVRINVIEVHGDRARPQPTSTLTPPGGGLTAMKWEGGVRSPPSSLGMHCEEWGGQLTSEARPEGREPL
jgi:hypothetical protein